MPKKTLILSAILGSNIIHRKKKLQNYIITRSRREREREINFERGHGFLSAGDVVPSSFLGSVFVAGFKALDLSKNKTRGNLL